MHQLTPRRLPHAGFSLVETMVAIAVMGLLMAVMVPKVHQAAVARDVKSARAAVANMFARARISALQSRRTTTINFAPDRVWVTAPITGGLDTVGTVTNLASEYGVVVDATAPTIDVWPTGLANAAVPVTVRVTRLGKSDSVVISGYGRLQ